jgi:protein-L-isoaspartate(D-aspartate) O-methyltransferase
MLLENHIQKANLIMDLRSMGILCNKVLSAIEETPREIFLPSNFHSYAYHNNPLPIGFEQTISQPYIVALMTQALSLKGNEIILEIGTGSGYQTSILSLLSRRVYSIERLKPLLVNAQLCFKKLKLTNIISEVGDGFLGWPKLAPFDHIIITCAIEKLDDRILNQIRVNGACIAPVVSSDKEQRLKKITIKNNRKDDIWDDLGKVSFVPLITNYD